MAAQTEFGVLHREIRPPRLVDDSGGG